MISSIDYSREMEGKIAIVTGGAAGTGKAITKALIEQGCIVHIACTNCEQARKVCKEEFFIEGPDGERIYRTMADMCDISDNQQVKAFVELVFNLHGRVDYLVNNAGISEVAFIPDIKEEDWDRIFAVNAKGTHLMTQAVFNKWRERKGDINLKPHLAPFNIVNICSESAHSPHTMCAPYVASKSAQLQDTKVAARELIKHSIRVNAINPSIAEGTELTAYLNEEFKKEYGWSEEEAQKMYLSKIPIGRFCKTSDVAKAVLFLLSSESSFIIGEGLMVSGGQSICGM